MTSHDLGLTAGLTVPSQEAMIGLLGQGDQNLLVIEELNPKAEILARGDQITIFGPPEAIRAAERLIEELLTVIERGGVVGPDDVRRVCTMLADRAPDDGARVAAAVASRPPGRPDRFERGGPQERPARPQPAGRQEQAGRQERSGHPEPADRPERPADVLTAPILSVRGRVIRTKTAGQKRYVDAIDRNTITFGIGPAGTGKTYLAMAKAVQALQAKRVARIVLTRPAVEAGERLGFLPGTLSEKIDPYLRPLYDALADMIDPDAIGRLIDSGTIEVAPLAYMRGRTLNDAFIILDEAQNTSNEQMKMFLTRLGFRATMVVTGDVTQTDLPTGVTSGLRAAQRILNGLPDLAFCELTSADVVRHRLVAQIIDAYEEAGQVAAAAASSSAGGRRGKERA